MLEVHHRKTAAIQPEDVLKTVFHGSEGIFVHTSCVKRTLLTVKGSWFHGARADWSVRDSHSGVMAWDNHRADFIHKQKLLCG